MMNHYRLIIEESLDPAWAAWLGELTLSRNKDGTTALDGKIDQQNQLLRLLNKLQDLGVTLIAVEPVEEDHNQNSNSAVTSANVHACP